ncbi:hypothetical protein CMI37_23380 [Candidatus Pacearchaeota archaeon]|nr:hypothetical protein [Candidatus Pacearchaeota archaeon]|tara:strand:- start:593 stop:2764 length:2172 start_codon:yes stop_codon:yes gene_type:complete
MLKSILDVYLDKAGVESGTLASYYNLSGSVTGPDEDSFFKLTSGASNSLDTYLIYNQIFSTGSQLYPDSEGNPLISTDNYPAVISSTSTTPTGSGFFDGKSSLKISKPFTGESWTCFFDFSGYDIDSETFGLNQVLFSTMKDPFALSGFNVGINGSNRFYYEYISGQEGTNYHRVSETLPAHLKSLNLVSLAKNDESIEFSLHKPNEETVSLKNFIDNFSRSNDMYIGGMSNGGAYSQFYTGYSGYMNTFIFFDEYITETTRDTVAESFFVTGYTAETLVTGETINKEVTGVEVQNVLSGVGITSYSLTQDGTYSNEAGNDVPIYALKGVEGDIYTDVLVDLTGQNNVSSISGYYKEEEEVRDEHYIRKSNTVPGKIKFDEPLLNGEVYELYSHRSFLNTINHRTEKNLYSFGYAGGTPVVPGGDGEGGINVKAMEIRNDNLSYDPTSKQPFVQFFHNGVYNREVSGLYSVSDVFTNDFGNVGIKGSSATHKGEYFIHDNAAGHDGTADVSQLVEKSNYYLALNEKEGIMDKDDFGLFDIVSGATITGEYNPNHFPHPEFKSTDGYHPKDIYYNGMKLMSGVHYTFDYIYGDPDGFLTLNSELQYMIKERARFDFVPQASTDFTRVTGNIITETNEIDVENIYNEQLWRNGIRLIPGVDYFRTPLDSLLSGADYPSYANDSFVFDFSNTAIDVSIDENRANTNTKIFSFNNGEQKTNLFETTS